MLSNEIGCLKGQFYEINIELMKEKEGKDAGNLSFTMYMAHIIKAI